MTISTVWPRPTRRLPAAAFALLWVRRRRAPVLHRRDRRPTITVRGDIAEHMQPPEVSAEVERALVDIRAALPPGYRIDTGPTVLTMPDIIEEAFAAVGVASKIHCASGAIRCQPKTRS